MGISRAVGLVLSSGISGESDIVCELLTVDGRKRFVIKGLKKSGRRDKAASYAGSVIDFSYHSRGAVPAISNFSVIAFPAAASADLLKGNVLQCALEFLQKTTVENDPHHGIFETARSLLSYLEDTPRPLHLLAGFIVRCIKLHGILPQLNVCTVCGEEPEFVRLDHSGRECICEKCLGEKRFATRGLSRKNARYIRDLSAKSFSGIDHAQFSESEALECVEQLLNYAERYFHIELNSLHILKRILTED